MSGTDTNCTENFGENGLKKKKKSVLKKKKGLTAWYFEVVRIITYSLLRERLLRIITMYSIYTLENNHIL